MAGNVTTTPRPVLDTPRIRKLKRERAKTRKRKILLWFIACILFFVGLGFLSNIPQMRITNVVIEGTTVVSKDVVLAKVQEQLFGKYFFLYSKQNFLLYPKGSIEHALLRDVKRLATVQVSLDGPHTLVVRASEREGRYLWCGHTLNEAQADIPDLECYYLDSNGYVFSRSPYFSGNVYIKFFGTGLFGPKLDPVGRQFLSVESFDMITRFVSALHEFSINPYAVLVKDTGDFDIYISSLEPGRLVYTKMMVSSRANTETLIANLRAALAAPQFKSDFENRFSDLLYIDLRFANKVYYKFKTATTEF